MRIVMNKSGCKSARFISKLVNEKTNSVCVAKFNPSKINGVFHIAYGQKIPGAHLNANLIFNKKKALNIMRKAGVPTPKIYEKKDVINLTEDDFPLIGRTFHHSKGKDVVFYKTINDFKDTHDYYLEYIPKWSEYRVHVLGDEAVCVVAKTHDNREEEKRNIVWNYGTGWKQMTYNGIHERTLMDIGLQAVKALGYDFGAVDVIRRSDSFYVLEVNSAPGLIDKRAIMYATYFSYKEKQWKGVIQ